MEITGNIIHILPAQSGQGKNGAWKKQEFVLETSDTYPKKACLAAWGDKIDVGRLSVGQTVKVNFDVESREYNGKWYTDLKAFSLQVINENKNAEVKEQQINTAGSEDDLPF
ncbi:MAG: DUF3127 domain-containing protein [Chitinophagaceae bacterium]